MKSILFTILVLFSAKINAEKIRYDNYKVYRVLPTTKTHFDYLKELESKPHYNFWSDLKLPGFGVDIMVPPTHHEEFEETSNFHQLDFNVFIHDVQKHIENERPNKEKSDKMDWIDYYTLEEIYAWLEKLAKDYPDNVKVVKGGSTYENRDILGVHVSFGPGKENKTVFVESNIHACEWIGSAVSTYILNELLTSTNSTRRQLAESYDWYFFPVFNPDGYAYTHQTDRLWRKTRVPHGDCIGADPNRNWDYHYDEAGTSNDSCAANYSGPKAFSEPCTKTLSEFLSTIGHTLEGYISFHSYSQILLLPYGYTTDHLDNYDQLRKIGLKGLNSLTARFGTEYQIGNVAEILYAAAGGSPDWIKGTFGTKITYTYELRDTGRYGFILPADQIIPTAEETLESLITIFEEFAKEEDVQ